MAVGGPAVSGERLDPDAAALLAPLNANPPTPLHLCTPEEARERHERAAASIIAPLEPVAGIEDGEVAGVPVRTYHPGNAVGTTVYVHGGGWVTGTFASYDRVCRIMANRSATDFVVAGYALAPETKYPVQRAQVYAVLDDACRRIPNGVVLASDSAGSYLAIQAALRARDAGLPIRALVLLNPVIDPALDTESARTRATGYRLDTESLRWYWRHFLPDGRLPRSLFEESLARLPSTFIMTAGFDPLHDEGIQFADALSKAGVPIQHLDCPGQIHGFLRLGHAIKDAHRVHDIVGTFIRDHARAN